MKKSPDIISQRIREVIAILGGLKKTSDIAKISMPQLSDYQTGKDKPGALPLVKLSRAGGVTVDWILGLDLPSPFPLPRRERIKGEGGLEVEVRESPETYGLDAKDQKLVKEVEELLRDADDDVKRHLRNQIKLLRRVQRLPKKRASGED